MPSFEDPTWTNYHLIVGDNPKAAIRETSQHVAHRAMMNLAKIQDKKKVTHRSRVLGAQLTQVSGASIEAIAQHGNWALNRLTTHYLSRVDVTAALHMAGFNITQNERLWLPRNTAIPSIELQRQVFPLIEEQFPGDSDWAIWIENIMMDRDIYHNRPLRCPTRSSVNNGEDHDDPNVVMDKDDNVDVPKRQHQILLTHLRKVLLQDAVAIMATGEADYNCPYVEHHIFQHPVFKSQMLHDYKAHLLQQMAAAESPLASSLAAASPSIHNEFQELKAQMRNLTAEVRVIQAAGSSDHHHQVDCTGLQRDWKCSLQGGILVAVGMRAGAISGLVFIARSH